MTLRDQIRWRRGYGRVQCRCGATFRDTLELTYHLTQVPNPGEHGAVTEPRAQPDTPPEESDL